MADVPVNGKISPGQKKYSLQHDIPSRGKGAYPVIKRLMDIVFSLFVIIAIFPWLMPLLAIIIKLNSKGPVFFKQRRVGMKGNVFVCLKLRTMYVNNFADTKQAVKNDPRITRAGHFLRNSGVDELPQFINILVGHMSLVGPRPHMLKDDQDFSALIPGYNLRHSVRPGITGIAQVKGYRGPSGEFESILMRSDWDNYYVRHIGFGLDCTIICKTIILTIRSVINRDEPVENALPVLDGEPPVINETLPAHPAQPSLSKLRY